MEQQSTVGKIFTIPYIDALIEKKHIPATFKKCIVRYVSNDDEITYGEVISKIYAYMDKEYRNEYFCI